MIYFKTVLDLTFGMVGMILLIRFTGKKTMSDLTPYDLVYILMIGGILEQVLYEEQRPVTYVLWALLVWGTLILLIERWALNADRNRHKLKGRASVLVSNGILNLKELEQNHIELEQLRTLFRENGCFSLKKVNYLVFEVDGQVSLLTNEDVADTFTFLLIDEGEIEENVLQTLNKDSKWLLDALYSHGYNGVSEIVYCEWSHEEGFYIISYQDTMEKNMYIDG